MCIRDRFQNLPALLAEIITKLPGADLFTLCLCQCCIELAQKHLRLIGATLKLPERLFQLVGVLANVGGKTQDAKFNRNRLCLLYTSRCV